MVPRFINQFSIVKTNSSYDCHKNATKNRNHGSIGIGIVSVLVSNFLNHPSSLFFHPQNLWGNRVPGEQDQRRDDRILKNKKKAVKVLMFVVVIFTVCWLPLQTYQVLSVIVPQVNR